jgi:hypothetical protein
MLQELKIRMVTYLQLLAKYKHRLLARKPHINVELMKGVVNEGTVRDCALYNKINSELAGKTGLQIIIVMVGLLVILLNW